MYIKLPLPYETKDYNDLWLTVDSIGIMLWYTNKKTHSTGAEVNDMEIVDKYDIKYLEQLQKNNTFDELDKNHIIDLLEKYHIKGSLQGFQECDAIHAKYTS